MRNTKCTDSVILNLWHPVGVLAETPAGKVMETRLLEEPISFAVGVDGLPVVWRSRPQFEAGDAVDAGSVADALPVKSAYGYIWTSLGQPAEDIFPIQEFDEADRRRLHVATIGVNVSAPRVVENFLDLGHLPYVHSGILGVEPHTEVKDYDVEISAERDEILATRCRFFQPKASASARGGADVDYVYRVPHPYCAVLYKTSPLHTDRLDVIAIFVQPVDQEHVRAHFMNCRLDEESEDKIIKRFQLTIFGQDKPILENQFPKRLPLDPRAEMPIRADKSAIAYRRWLSQKGVSYGVIRAAT